MSVESLHTYGTLNQFHNISGFCADVGSNVSEMESIGKSLGAYLKFFDLSFMPRLPPFFQKLASQNKVCLDVIGAYKIVFCLKKVSECDAVGRPYWETHKATELVDLACTTASYSIGTVKLIGYLASITLSSSLNFWKIGLTTVAFSCRGYNDFYAVQKLESSLSKLEERRTRSNNKVRETSKELLLQKYRKVREATGRDLAQEKSDLNTLCAQQKITDLNAAREEAARHLNKINKLELKLKRVEKYLDTLDFVSVERFNELKKIKWDNRVEIGTNNLRNKTYSRNFNTSFAVSLAFSLLATVFAVQNIVLLTGVALVSVGASSIGMAWLVNKPTKKTYEII